MVDLWRFVYGLWWLNKVSYYYLCMNEEVHQFGWFNRLIFLCFSVTFFCEFSTAFNCEMSTNIPKKFPER